MAATVFVRPRSKADPEATIVSLPDRNLGHRLGGTAENRAAVAADLEAQGVNPLISGAFRPRGAAEAA
ncbi:MAG: hypothetical protein ACM3Z4_11610 [Hyphomicrobiales bacterium]